MLQQHGTLNLSLASLRNNLRLIREKIGPHAQICPALKANAYGHGISTLTPLLAREKIEWCSVYSLPEIAAIAPALPLKILVLAPLVFNTDPSPKNIQSFLQHADPRCRFVIAGLTTLLHLAKMFNAAPPASPLNVHIQVDTGLTRAGADPADADALADAVAKAPHLHLEGIFAHLSHGDVPGHPTLQQQRDALLRIAAPLKQKHPHLLIHLQNSGGAFHIHDPHLDMVRIGIALYGLQPSTAHPIPGLQPIAQLTAPILAIHLRPANTGVGYGHTFTTQRSSRLAIVPVGYADGYPRQLSNTKNAFVQLHNTTAPVVGRVSMDQIIVDITNIPAARIGDTVAVISNNPADPNALDQIATAIGTINYELATHFGERLKRVIVD